MYIERTDNTKTNLIKVFKTSSVNIFLENCKIVIADFIQFCFTDKF